jgi:hypothetical protein
VFVTEIRSHGTGYFGFSRDEEKRAEELKELRQLSNQTEATRARVVKEKKSKKAQLSERLKKIRAKQRAKRGLPPEEEGELVDDDDEDDGDKMMVEEETNEDKEKEEKSKSEMMRPWDFGKPGVFGPRPKSNLPADGDDGRLLDEKWVRDRRSDRIEEFAPPSNIYSDGGLKRAYYKAAESATSSSSSSSRQNPYANFVRPMEEEIKPVVPKVPEGFKPPEQFWKQRTNPSISKPPQVPIPIVDECSSSTKTRTAAAPPAKDDDGWKRKGAEIAPPPTFDYYHGEGGRRKEMPPRKVDNVDEAVSSGLKALREKFEAEQRQKKEKEGGGESEAK